MKSHVIVGRGAAASKTALLLAEDGERVRMISRTGGGPDHPLIDKVTADATDTDRLTELTEGPTRCSPLPRRRTTFGPSSFRSCLGHS